MVSTGTRGSGRLRKNREEEEEVENEGGDGNIADYEESRAERIKENAERMKSLGLFDLSKNLKVRSSKPRRKLKRPSTPSNNPPRRSSRLKDLPLVSYIEEKTPKKSVVEKNVKIHIEEGERPEVYTKEHEKLLGESKDVWDLCVDGYDEDGQRMYDPAEGKSCHQCRQKTLGLHTECSKCKLVTGQFCGDCLYMRYGENIKEVNENSDWVCPVCREICNCSRCRRDKGWMPIGAIYNRVAKLGFKSVAHYLIHTRRGQATEWMGPGNPTSGGGSVPIDDGKEELITDALSMPSFGVKKIEGEKDDVKPDSDEEYIGDDNEDEDEDEDEDDSDFEPFK